MKNLPKVGDHVIYIPNHANGDVNHPEREHGVVTSLGGLDTVFVKYVRNNQLQQTAQATDISNLEMNNEQIN